MRQIKSLGLAAFALAVAAVSAPDAYAQDSTAGRSDDAFLSRITIAIPFFTHHFPRDGDFNDHNWGGVIFYALDSHISLVGGDFSNSYRRNTGFAGVSITPWNLTLSSVDISPGALVGVDLTGGYTGYDPVAPFLAAATLTISAARSSENDTRPQFLDRLGLLVTVIPGFGSNRSTASNVALTFRL